MFTQKAQNIPQLIVGVHVQANVCVCVWGGGGGGRDNI